LCGHSNERACKLYHEWFDGGFFGTLDEVSDGICGLFALFVAACCKTCDDDGCEWRYAFWEVVPWNGLARSSRRFDASTEGYNEGF
jgi:hypothetical protein